MVSSSPGLERLKELSGIYPRRNPVRWEMRNKKIVVTYRKNLSFFESFLQRRLGGSLHIRRPLDELGSRMWMLCDGRHSLAEMIGIMSRDYHERIEPPQERVWAFIEVLLNTGLVRLERAPRGRLPLRVVKK